MTPTLATSCAVLPPKGARLAWGGPARRWMTPTLATSCAVQSLFGGAVTLGRPGST